MATVTIECIFDSERFLVHGLGSKSLELNSASTRWWQKGLASRIDQMWYLEPKWLR